MKDPTEIRQPEREQVKSNGTQASHDMEDAGDMHSATANAQVGVQTKKKRKEKYDACALK